MDRHSAASVAKPGSSSPRTEASTFTISPLDVGSLAVRPGCMADVEHERQVLLLACKLVLGRIRTGQVPIGATYEYALEAAIKSAEPRK
jgi:hypothetical protein